MSVHLSCKRVRYNNDKHVHVARDYQKLLRLLQLHVFSLLHVHTIVRLTTNIPISYH